MRIIADLHLHSKYSRAVSQKMGVLEIAGWAKRKGIDLVASGDWTHPLWLREIKANLEEDGTGLLRLRSAKIAHENLRGPLLTHERSQGVHDVSGARSEATSANFVGSPRFLLSTEISSIYTQGGKQRRIHNLVFAPSISVVEKINKELEKRGTNLFSDGRPIIGLSAQQLTEVVLEVDQRCLVIPAHVWTPWYSLYGSMSGFDSIRECFGKMSQYIYAIETGLSSDPLMNWQIKELDHRAILSFSDAHSGAKLGREATVFKLPEGRLSYEMIRQAIVNEHLKGSGKADQNLSGADDRINRSTGILPRIAYTIEFYPEEGKYHYTGHRNCQVRQSPEETKKLGRACPVCGRPLTVGVMHRVQALAARKIEADKLKIKIDENGVRWIRYQNRRPYVTLVPLLEILSETLGGGVASQNVINEYQNLTSRFGGEFGVLLKVKIEEIAKVAGKRIAEAIKKVRGGKIIVEPGFDGQFGKVKIWKEKEERQQEEKKQLSLF